MWLASQNVRKCEEVSRVLGVPVAPADQYTEVDEVGTSYRENALLKASSLHVEDGVILADDSGLEVEGLMWPDGRLAGTPYPGVDTHQVREKYGTVGALRHYRELAGEDQLVLYDCCTLCVVKMVSGRVDTVTYFEARVRGKTSQELQGDDKFDYDLYFVPDTSTVTYGQMSPAEKLTHSARGHVLRQLLKFCK